MQTLDTRIQEERSAADESRLATVRHEKTAALLATLGDNLQNGAAHLETVAEYAGDAGWPDSLEIMAKLNEIAALIRARL